MKYFIKISVLAMIFLISLNAFAGKLSEKDKQMFAKNVIVPLPSEILLALNKITSVKWSKLNTYNYTASYTKNYKIAMNIGVKTAYGFEAIQAKDKKNIGEMFSITKSLAENFGGKKVFKDIAEIKTLIAKNKWKVLREKLDKYQDLLQKEMTKYNPDFVVLASVSGWVEGLRITTKALSTSYDKEASKLLHQPLLINSFVVKLNALSSDLKSKKEVKALIDAVAKIKKLTESKKGDSIDKKNIEELYKISSNLVTLIEKEK